MYAFPEKLAKNGLKYDKAQESKINKLLVSKLPVWNLLVSRKVALLWMLTSIKNAAENPGKPTISGTELLLRQAAVNFGRVLHGTGQ